MYNRIMKRISLVLVSTLLLLGAMPAPSTFAVSGNQFNSGRIIDDAIFFNINTMSGGDIQNFLNSKVPTCDTNHAKSSSSYDSGPPYTCLKDYRTDMQNESADAYCNAISSASNVSSAEIIYQVSRACGINPQVMIVLIQKEQALVTDAFPWNYEYQFATGFCVYDSTPPPSCAGTDGFFNQVYYAARQFKKYQNGSYTFVGGRTSPVQYSPHPSCGSSNIFMQTNATAALYNYTPYQPSQAALDNMYGSAPGDPNTPGTAAYCGAYGNRNFWRYFNDWFGPTISDSNINILGFVRLNDSSGHVQDLGYSSISSYSFAARTDYSSYPAVPGDGAVVPLYKPNGDLSFVRLNHSSGNVEVVSYTASSGFKQLSEATLTGYPAVGVDRAVKPFYTR